MCGIFMVYINYFLVDEWMIIEEIDVVYSSVLVVDEEVEIFDCFDLFLDVIVNKIVYEEYEFINSVLKGCVMFNCIEVSSMKLQLGESDFVGSGIIFNGFDYVFDDGVLQGNM